MSKCPWAETMGPERDMCLLKTLEDGKELVYCTEEFEQEPRTDEASMGPFMVCFDISETDIPVAQVFVGRGGTYKFVKEIVGDEALELHRVLNLASSLK